MPVILDSSEIKVIDGDKNFTIETVKSNVIVNQDTEINEPTITAPDVYVVKTAPITEDYPVLEADSTNLVAWYKFDDEGNNEGLLDSSGNNHNLTIPAGSTPIFSATSKFGKSAYEGGTEGKIQFPSSLTNQLYTINDTNGITFTFWYNMATNAGTWSPLFEFSENATDSTTTERFSIVRNSNQNNLWFGLKESGTYYELRKGSVDGQWHYITWSIDSLGNWTIYFDNVNQNVSMQRKIPNTTYNYSYIFDNIQTTQSYTYIDDFRIYDKALSAEEIDILFNDKVKLEITPVPLQQYTEERMYPPTRDLASASHLISGESYGNGVYEVSESDGTYDPSKTGFSAFNTSMSDRVHFNNKYTNGVYNGSDYIVPGYLGDWIKIKLPRPIKLTRYGFKQRLNYLIRAPGKYKLYGSNDGTNWDVLVHKRNTISYTQQISFANDYFEENINVNNQYQYFGLVVNQLYGNEQYFNFDEWYIYGKEFISEEPEYKLLTFEYQPTDLIFTFREDESPYSWQEAYDEAIANGKRMPTKTELLDYLASQGNQPIYQQDTWCPVIAPEYTNGKDWIHIGNHGITFTGGHFVGKSHTEYYGYPSWGDNADGSYAKFYCEVIEYNQTEYSVNFPEDTECDILIVGGGGVGGSGTSQSGGGGGGGGQVILLENQVLNGQQNIKVGRGGVGVLNVVWQNGTGETGKNSSFNTTVGYGGGGGGMRNVDATATYTGGGGGGYGGALGDGSGFDGGNGGDGDNGNEGGGGGAGAGGDGNDHNVHNGGDGGIGVDRVGSFIFAEKFGTSYGHLESGTTWFGGGGGGGGTNQIGTNGIGKHGGTDGNSSTGITENAQWGGGSGGTSRGSSSERLVGNGGSGIVIIRYKTQYQATTHGAQWTYHSANPNTHHYGNVGIGTTASATQKLLVNGDMNVTGNYKQNDNTIGNWYKAGTSIYRASGNVGIGNTAPQYSLHVEGGVYAGEGGTTGDGTTVWTSTSDSRMKDNIFKASYKECYDIFKKIELYRYNFKPGHVNSNDRNQLGFIAQEVQQQIPNSVEPRSIRLSSGVYIHDILTLNVTQINYILYGTFKYLIAELDIIKKHLESQEEAGQTE